MTSKPTLNKPIDRRVGKSDYRYDPKNKYIEIDGVRISIEQDSLNDPYMMCECKDSKPIGEDHRGRNNDYTCSHTRKAKRYFISEILGELWKKVEKDYSEFLASYEAHLWPRGTWGFLGKQEK